MKAMKKLNEKEIIRIFRQKKNLAEDVELFHLGKELCAANIDTLVESTDVPAKSDLVDIARKSVVSSVSDFAAKGIIPKFCIISVTIPKTFSKNQITKMATGFRKACNEFDLKLLGGDTNEGKEIVIHVVLFGKASKIVPRSGARNGDIIITTGAFGYTSSALQILLKKKKSTKKFSNIAKTKFFAGTVHTNSNSSPPFRIISFKSSLFIATKSLTSSFTGNFVIMNCFLLLVDNS